jgi:hypothetical protein
MPSAVEIWRPASSSPISTSMLPPGEHEIRLPFDERVLVMIVDAS